MNTAKQPPVAPSRKRARSRGRKGDDPVVPSAYPDLSFRNHQPLSFLKQLQSEIRAHVHAIWRKHDILPPTARDDDARRHTAPPLPPAAAAARSQPQPPAAPAAAAASSSSARESVMSFRVSAAPTRPLPPPNPPHPQAAVFAAARRRLEAEPLLPTALAFASTPAATPAAPAPVPASALTSARVPVPFSAPPRLFERTTPSAAAASAAISPPSVGRYALPPAVFTPRSSGSPRSLPRAVDHTARLRWPQRAPVASPVSVSSQFGTPTGAPRLQGFAAAAVAAAASPPYRVAPARWYGTNSTAATGFSPVSAGSVLSPLRPRGRLAATEALDGSAADGSASPVDALAASYWQDLTEFEEKRANTAAAAAGALVSPADLAIADAANAAASPLPPHRPPFSSSSPVRPFWYRGR